MTHCVSKMSPAEREKAMEWTKWKHPPMNALGDLTSERGLFCPNGMMLSWDLWKVGTPPSYEDSTWAAHCYPRRGVYDGGSKNSNKAQLASR